MFFVLYIQICLYIFLAHKPVTATIVKVRTEAASNTEVLDTFISRTHTCPGKASHTFHLC